MTDLERELEEHREECEVKNCPVCWRYEVHRLRKESRRYRQATATLWVAAGMLYVAALVAWLVRCA